ncbi:TPA: F-box protein [Legionella pneumophila]|nr:F-box protein [Legionella pneumophila]
MKSKFEYFGFKFLGQLPKELGSITASHLSTPDLIRHSKVSKGHRAYFVPILEERKVLQKFLHHVVRGEHDAWKEMLKKEIHLMYKKDQVTDRSGRTFSFISAFEYALWALDKHTWTMMLDCLPKTEEGKKVLEELIAQYDKVNMKGVTYRLNGKTTTEKHFDFNNTIIKELRTQVDSINADGEKDWGAIDKQWREGVGGAQKRLPMHIVDEYCSNEPFYPVPKFTSQPKSSKQFYNWTTNKDEDWFSVDSKLGSEVAIYKGALAHGAAARRRLRMWWFAGRDLDAMTALCEARTLDLINLKSQLEEQAGLENHYQIAPM